MISATYYMSDAELRKEIYDLRRGLRKDIKEGRDFVKKVNESLPYISLPTNAITDMAKLNTEMRKKAVANMSRRELDTLYRKLKYVRDLKGSTKKGIVEAYENTRKFQKVLRDLPEEKRKKFWDLYKETRQLNPSMDKFKYNFLNETITMIDKYMDSKDFAIQIDNLYTALEKEGKVSDERFIEFISSDIRKLLQ